MSDWLMDKMNFKEGWNSVTVGCGGPSVTMVGISLMLVWFAINLDMAVCVLLQSCHFFDDFKIIHYPLVLIILCNRSCTKL